MITRKYRAWCYCALLVVVYFWILSASDILPHHKDTGAMELLYKAIIGFPFLASYLYLKRVVYTA